MTNAVSKIPFSASTQGRGIKVAATSTPGTKIHDTGVSATVEDELWLYLYNGHTATLTATVEFGGVTVPDDNIVVDIPAKSGLVLVIPGLILKGSGAAVATVAVFAASGNLVVAYGYVNRITP